MNVTNCIPTRIEFGDMQSYYFDIKSNIKLNRIDSINVSSGYTLNYEYDNNGLLTKFSQVYDFRHTSQYQQYFYNSNKELIMSRYYSEHFSVPQDTIKLIQEVQYDHQDGKIIKSTHQNANSSFSFSIKYFYDDLGNIIRSQLNTTGDTTNLGYTYYQYDNSPHYLHLINYPISMTGLQVFQFNQVNNIISQSSKPPNISIDNEICSTNITYNNNNYPSVLASYNTDSQLKKYITVHYEDCD